MAKKYYAMIKGESGELEEVEIVGGEVKDNIGLWSKGIHVDTKTDGVVKDNTSGGRKITKLLKRIDDRLKN